MQVQVYICIDYIVVTVQKGCLGKNKNTCIRMTHGGMAGACPWGILSA